MQKEELKELFENSKNIESNLFNFEGKKEFLKDPPYTSIFGPGNIKTVNIQKIGPQKAEVDMWIKNSPAKTGFVKYQPFRQFCNILPKNGEFCGGPSGNNFFNAFYLAWATHGEIVLSPDDVWLAIIASFSQYIDQNAEELRSTIVSHEGKKDLIVIYMEPDPSKQDIHHKSFRWDELASGFSQEIQKNTKGDLQQLIQNNFSTTGIIERCCSQVALMRSCEQYFDFRCCVIGCGITKIHFLGKLEDWQQILEKTKQMILYHCKEKKFLEWIKNIQNIIEEFINTYMGNVNIQFWNSVIEKNKGWKLIRGGSGLLRYDKYQVITGWIRHFFLFDNKNKLKEEYIIDSQEFEEWANKHRFFSDWEKNNAPETKKCEAISLEDIPAFEWNAPVSVEFIDAKTRVGINMISGFTAVIKESNAFRPQITFAIEERDSTDIEKAKMPFWNLNKY